MPFEFSIILEDEREEENYEASKVVRLTFWDLLQTFEELNIASIFIIYHDKELDEIGKQLDAYSNQFWGASGDNIRDMIFISRQIYSWMEKRIEEAQDKELYKECMKFHKRNGVIGIDEMDEVQKVFFERAVLMKKREYLRKKRVHATISGVQDLLEKEAYAKAEQFWEEYKKAGKIIYYPPGELPIF
ncbi:MAG: hypothetical protein ACTSYB_18085 [Candidatus Helarchaeota archaeon]